MKKKLLSLLLILLIIFTLSGCSQEKIIISEAKLPSFQKLGDNEFDVIKLTFEDATPVYTDIGEIKEQKLYITEDVTVMPLKMVPEHILNEETKAPEKTGRYVSTLNTKMANYFRSKESGGKVKEGLIIFEGFPFLFYFNEKGEAFVKCLYIFEDYFKNDRSYEDFINFAVNFKPDKSYYYGTSK